VRRAGRSGQASFVIAITMPITTKTVIATCIQIHVEGIRQAYFGAPPGPRAIVGPCTDCA
jgi:hypothetical protein